ncbi:MAG: orotate phosphoribosyltransferase [Lewinella sp.]|jgi:orotate phosphoribosyltransferase|uniref:orotate phosphoribosyltransferase n=1 Tax=Lewinella sp. TaxID=2004506 RepID=UPI003D6A8891
MNNQDRIVARHLLQIKAIKLNPQNPFTWASGRRSPIYCDNRIVLSHPKVRSFIQDSLVEAAKSFQPFVGVAGVATAGIAHGALLADRLGVPFIYIRSKAKAHGRQNQIEGELQTGGRYLVIEDLISTGGSSLQAVEALRQAGGEVAGVMALFTYGFPEASKAFAGANCPISTLSHYPALLEEAVESGYITAEEQSLLITWREDPVAWSKQFEA